MFVILLLTYFAFTQLKYTNPEKGQFPVFTGYGSGMFGQNRNCFLSHMGL